MSLFNFPCLPRNFAGLKELGVSHSVACLFISDSYDLTQSSLVAIRILETKLFSSVSKQESKLVATVKPQS